MKAISEFEVEEYEKIMASLDLSDDDEDKSQYFNAWHFGETAGDYIVTNELATSYGTPRENSCHVSQELD